MILHFVREVQKSASIGIFTNLKLFERSPLQFLSHFVVEILPPLEPQVNIMPVKLD